MLVSLKKHLKFRPFPTGVQLRPVALLALPALLFILITASAGQAKQPVCGIALGFPPYQFEKDGRQSGFDADVARAVFARLKQNFTFQQDQWDTVFNDLRYGKIDLIVGIELTEPRRRFFEFTSPYYERIDVIFVREDNETTHSVEDLFYQLITGDRHSAIETAWKKKGIYDNIRIMHTPTKTEAMQMLASRRTVAAIMPKEVGFYLAQKLGLKVRILEPLASGTPVAIAVRKGKYGLITQYDTVLKELIAEGEIERLRQQWLLSE